MISAELTHQGIIKEIANVISLISNNQYNLLRALLLSSKSKEEFMHIAEIRMSELSFNSFEEADEFTKVLKLVKVFPDDQCTIIRSILSVSHAKQDFVRNILN